jgi:hypothetical protein
MLYTMVDGILYKHGRNGILLKGITQTEGISSVTSTNESMGSISLSEPW